MHVTYFDISEGPLERREQTLGLRFPGRVATQAADLNFVEFPPNAYDLIVSSSTIHHVTNLEHLAYQINRDLAPGGYFFLEDYVGEPRFAFSDEKKRLYEVIFNRDAERQGNGRPGLVWRDASDLSPFCGVRSDEILPVLRSHLTEVEVHTAGTLVTPLTRSRPARDVPWSPWDSDSWVLSGPKWRLLLGLARHWFPWLLWKHPSTQSLLSDELLSELFLVGDVLVDVELLRPGLAFAVYRKRASDGLSR